MISRSIVDICNMVNGELQNLNGLNHLIQGVQIDSRKIENNQLYIPIIGQRNDGHTFIHQAIENGAVATLWNRSIPDYPTDIPVIFVDDTLQALQLLASEYRKQLQCKVVAITGSNGKTSTKDILSSVLSQKYHTVKTQGNLNNEIGVPLTILSCSDACEVLVIELGMEKEKEISFLSQMVRPDFAIVTNVGNAHFENFESLDKVAQAKLEIIDGLHPCGMFLYNGDQECLVSNLRLKKCEGLHMVSFGMHSDNTFSLVNVKHNQYEMLFQIGKESFIFHLPMLGVHQVYNAGPCVYIARKLGLDDHQIQQGFYFVDHSKMRNELHYIDNCIIVDDSYKSNPQSAQASIQSFQFIHSNYRMIVMGDMLDLGKSSAILHYRLGCYIGEQDIQEVLTYGQEAMYIAQGVFSTNPKIKVRHFFLKEDVVSYLKTYRKQDCSILIKGSRSLKMDEIVKELLEEGVVV